MIDLKPDLSLLAIIAIFIVNYLIVKKWLVHPINNVLEWRNSRVREADQKYEEALTRLNAATRDIEDRLMEAKREATEVREAYRKEAGGKREAQISQTRAEAEKMIADATASLDQDLVAAREAILRDSEQLARLAAERILGRKLA
ncbi:MAG: ATP synthase F0 subunit B [Acidobacteria bacterium]|nr:ATP synthase F0 subunit B [Acidobacteriota bacterium]